MKQGNTISASYRTNQRASSLFCCVQKKVRRSFLRRTVQWLL